MRRATPFLPLVAGLLGLLASAPGDGAQPAAGPDPAGIGLASVHAAVVDLDSGDTLYRKHADRVVPIASVTKLMTAVVVLESGQPLDEWLTIVERDRPAPNNGFTHLRPGSQLQRGDLLRLALMASENHAAYVLARHHPGGFEAFVDAMNARAAALGAERFVLDDGWFGRRDDDTTSLGDWTIDRRKWPDGLGPLIDRVHALGMVFGLWVEPEMVNRDSDLWRAHPDWLLGPDDQIPGRAQYVLDLARAEVRDHLFAAISAVLADYPVDYVKLDHNRVLPVADAAQADGFYDLLDRLRAAHPAVEFESCASGGGRIDFGVLARSHRVWLSDSNDALERLRIQHDAALFLPGAVTGAHVGPRSSHSSGRILPVAFRAWVAAQRHMGFEMDLRELTDAEAATLASVTAWWKANRGWLMHAAIHRLDSADPAVLAEIQIAEDLFIAPVEADERDGAMLYSNHSCKPNIAMQGQVVFVAMRDIAAGEEGDGEEHAAQGREREWREVTDGELADRVGAAEQGHDQHDGDEVALITPVSGG